MRPSRLLRTLFSGLLLCLVALSGWVLWAQRRQYLQATRQLQRTQTALTEKDTLLTALQDEQQRLAEAYDTLKTRWAQSDQQVKQLTETAAQRAKETDALSRTRSSLEQQLQETRAAQAQLQQQLQGLQREVTAKAAETATLTQRLKELDRRAMTEAELEQLAELLEDGQKRQAFLKERILELSNAYEALARQAPAAAAAKPASADLPPVVVPDPRVSEAHRRKQADLQRQLGDIYLAAYQFDKAAQAFEQSLALHDDPNVHAQLAFIYNRFLHDEERANRHVALAIGVEPATRALDPMAHQQGLPRRDERLVWKWLIQDDSPNARATNK